MHDSEHHLPKERTSDPYVLRFVTVSPQKPDTWSRLVRLYAVMGAGGVDGCQRGPWSEGMVGKGVHGAGSGDLEPTEWYYSVFKGVVP